MALAINDSETLKHWQKILLISVICLITFCSDWSCIAVMAILFIGDNRGDFKKQMIGMMFWTCIYGIVYFFAIDRVYGILQLGTCLSIPILYMYNGTRGKWHGMSKLFYIYYPAHMFVCGLIRIFM